MDVHLFYFVINIFLRGVLDLQKNEQKVQNSHVTSTLPKYIL